MKKIFLFLLLPVQLWAQQPSPSDITRWEKQAKQVTIIRDNWGIPHIYGKTDADCVFGVLYAQCEDDFKRVESNYIGVLGRTAEIKGKSALSEDLLTKLMLDSAGAVADYEKSPAWLKKLLDAYADGINYFLYKNPSVRPALLHHFEPWYPLLWTDGSISAIQTGGVTAADINSAYLSDMLSMPNASVQRPGYDQQTDLGSNGFALAPAKTASHNAILWINPHVTFYFRSEVQMVSEEGLNAYGAITWGQFFVYQGFNEHCGWMHTSSYADGADTYVEDLMFKDGLGFYRYDDSIHALTKKKVVLGYTNGGSKKNVEVDVYYTHHGPVMAHRDGKWITVKAVNRSMDGLIQSWMRTKAKGFDDYKKTMELRANNSNNTTYADDKGNIAYWHGNFIPRRDTKYNWSEPVDGSTSATEWKGLHTLDEMIHVYNPSSGWTQNCNSTPYTLSGESSPKKDNYPFYMATEPENFRGINAARLLAKGKDFTIDKLITTGYDTYLAGFEKLIPCLVSNFENYVKADDPLYSKLSPAIAALKTWDMRSSANSVATTLAVEWAQRLAPRINRVILRDKYAGFVEKVLAFTLYSRGRETVDTLAAAMDGLALHFGTWQVPWGEINRYQRLTGQLQETYDDSKPSIPSGMASSAWGCLPSFVSRTFPGTNKKYGYNGNSFICAVEFGKTVKAKSLITGGESSNPSSPHFGDQAEMYTKGQFKDVLFYKEDVLKHAEKTYHPGD